MSNEIEIELADELKHIKSVASNFKEISEHKVYQSVAIPKRDDLRNHSVTTKSNNKPHLNLDPFIEVEIDNPTDKKIVTANHIPKFVHTNPIREKFFNMREIARNAKFIGNYERIFYEQAKFMVDFEDDYLEIEPYSTYFSNYQQMSYEQLRTYFTWRKNVRLEIIEKVPVSYAFLYIYELLHLIGFKNANDAIIKLVNFWKEFREFDKKIDGYLIPWFKDFHVYYELPWIFIDFVKEQKLEIYYPKIFIYTSDKDNSLLLFNEISNYDITKSKFYPDKTNLIKSVFYFLLSKLRIKFNEHGKRFEDLIYHPLPRNMTWTPFNRAIFFPYKEQTNREESISPREIFFITPTDLRYSSTLLANGGKILIAFILKTMESEIRIYEKFKYKLKSNSNQIDEFTKEKLDTIYLDLDLFIIESVKEYYRLLNYKEVSVNVQNIGRIREDAYLTQEKLIVHDEFDVFVKDEIIIEEIDSVLEISDENEWIRFIKSLSDVDLEAVKITSRGKDLNIFARKHFIMTEVLVDRINEISVDIIGDSILEFDGDEVIIYDEYITDLMIALDL